MEFFGPLIGRREVRVRSDGPSVSPKAQRAAARLASLAVYAKAFQHGLSRDKFFPRDPRREGVGAYSCSRGSHLRGRRC